MQNHNPMFAGFNPVIPFLLGHLLQLGVKHSKNLKRPPSMPSRESRAMNTKHKFLFDSAPHGHSHHQRATNLKP